MYVYVNGINSSVVKYTVRVSTFFLFIKELNLMIMEMFIY
ncbi:hypothetical protein Solca_1638 [Solitalea canadensis DSM 3403]|uniref:Uncharacterized protein n=1 Tax=Solitalea canadensis (strain ATCC 29591 / DSM 3403 / JCM 21819 / LMG 8368 / NBRC 15130 / NCIMB 12057 / USAM 9D) TaxID=929556 RepID=H8KVT2_SOLCM|nr:hypothetical protein Solca_1638 [Solitalea canadensis DSM 3403]